MKKKKYKNLLNPTKAQIKHRNELWAKALQENEKKAVGVMYDGEGGRCCLAVAQDVAVSCGLELEFGIDSFLPDVNTTKFFGWNDIIPLLDYAKGGHKHASLLNDGGASHKQIAGMVLRTFCQ